MRDRCSECGRMVDGQYVKGTSVGEDTRSALKTVAKVGVGIGNALGSIPGPSGFLGKVTGRLISAGAQSLVGYCADAISSPRYYKFRCACGHTRKRY